jgi:hypothetical protein
MLLRVSKKLVRELRRVKSCHAVHGEDLAQTIPRKRYNNTTPFLHTSKPPPLTSSTAPLEKPSRRSSVDSYRHQRIPPASYSSRVPFECPLPGQFDISRHAAQLRGRQREDHLVRRVQYDTHLGRQHLPAIPPHPYTQIFLPDTSAHEDTGFIRHQAYPAKENVERPSALQVKHRLRIRPPVSLVELVALVLILFHSSFVPVTTIRPGPIFYSVP